MSVSTIRWQVRYLQLSFRQFATSSLVRNQDTPASVHRPLRLVHQRHLQQFTARHQDLSPGEPNSNWLLSSCKVHLGERGVARTVWSRPQDSHIGQRTAEHSVLDSLEGVPGFDREKDWLAMSDRLFLFPLPRQSILDCLVQLSVNTVCNFDHVDHGFHVVDSNNVCPAGDTRRHSRCSPQYPVLGHFLARQRTDKLLPG